jgi:hypothetical protein
VHNSSAPGAPSRVAVAAMAVLVLLGVACTKTDDLDVATSRTTVSFDPTEGDPVAASVLIRAGSSTCGEVTSGRISTELVLGSASGEGSSSARLTAEGSFDAPGGRTRFSIDVADFIEQLTGNLGQSGLGARFTDALGDDIEVVGDGDTIYVDAAIVRTLFGSTTTWVRLPMGGELGGLGTWIPSQARDACDVVSLLDRVGDEVVELGSDQIDGVAVTHYRTTVPTDEAAGAFDLPIPPRSARGDAVVDVWVDDDGVVRRLEVQLDDSAGGVGALVVFELSDVNEPVVIELPPDDQVSELDPEQGLFGLGGS